MDLPWDTRRLLGRKRSPRNQLLHYDWGSRSTRFRWNADDPLFAGQYSKRPLPQGRLSCHRTLWSLLALRRHSLGLPLPLVLSNLGDAMNTTYLYLLVFAILVGSTDIEVNIVTFYPSASNSVSLLFGTIALSYGVIVSIHLGLAGMKALLIALFYQHLKYEPRSLSSWVLIGLVMASLLMSLVFIQLHVH